MIYEWPNEWYQFPNSTFHLTARSQTTPKTWSGGKSVYGPHAQFWMTSFAIAPQYQDESGQYMQAFFSRLDGQSNLIRIGDPARRAPQYNRLTAAGSQAWSDGTFFNDGTGWSSNLLADTCYVAVAAARGDNFIVLGGLAVSISRALRRGDLIELRPSGVATTTPNLYEVQADNSTNSAGQIGLEIRPRLRQGFAVGDMAVLVEPKSVFRLLDDDQGLAAYVAPAIANISFNLVEAV